MADIEHNIRKLVGKMRESDRRTAEKFGPFTRRVESMGFDDGPGTIGVIRDRNGKMFGYCHPDDIETVEVPTYAFLTWDPAEFEPEALRESLTSVRQELGLTRNGRMRSVLRDSDLWRLLTAVVVAGREVVDA